MSELISTDDAGECWIATAGSPEGVALLDRLTSSYEGAAVQMLLDGLGVESIADLAYLVERGRWWVEEYAPGHRLDPERARFDSKP